MTTKLGFELIVTHLSGDRDGFEKALAVAREITSGHEANMKDSPAWLAYQLNLTLVAAVDGQAKQVETRVRQIRRRLADDNTTLGGILSLMCQVLGISGAGKAAASCLRSALIEPSFVRYYMEPRLPYYDSVREHPDFVQLVADIDAGKL